TGGEIMLRQSSCVRHGVWSCALGALMLGAGCGSSVIGAASESVGNASASGSGGSGGAAVLPGSGGSDAGVAPDPGAPNFSEAFGNAYPYSVAVDLWGNIVIAGYFHDSVDFGAGQKLVSAGGLDAFIVKLDPAGKAIWSKQFGGAEDQWAR